MVLRNLPGLAWALVITVGLLGCESKKPEPEAARSSGATPTATTQQNTTAQSEVPAALLSPDKATEKAPEAYKVKFTTTKGSFVVDVTRSWSPNGADRLYNLVKLGYFKDVAFFRAIEGFMVQFGIHGNPRVASAWDNANIPDDPVKESNKRGYLTFAKTGMPNSRSTQLFISYADNSRLDSMGFSPLGKVIEGMDVVDGLYKGYGEGAPKGNGPDQGTLQSRGNAYLKEQFPKLDYIQSASLVP